MANEMAEFARNFELCFFRALLKVKKSPRAFLVHTVDLAHKKVVGETNTMKMSANSFSYDYEEFLAEAEPIVPHAGYLNVTLGDRPTALYLHVQPDRQYRKALHYEEGIVVPVPNNSPTLADYCKTHGKGKYDLFLRTYAHQLAMDPIPRYTPFRWAVDQVSSGLAHSIAISRFFAVSLTHNLKYPVIWHKQQNHGVIINGAVYATDGLLPFTDFFMKKWNTHVFPMEQAQKLRGI